MPSIASFTPAYPVDKSPPVFLILFYPMLVVATKYLSTARRLVKRGGAGRRVGVDSIPDRKNLYYSYRI